MVRVLQSCAKSSILFISLLLFFCYWWLSSRLVSPMSWQWRYHSPGLALSQRWLILTCAFWFVIVFLMWVVHRDLHFEITKQLVTYLPRQWYIMELFPSIYISHSFVNLNRSSQLLPDKLSGMVHMSMLRLLLSSDIWVFIMSYLSWCQTYTVKSLI